MPAPYPPPPSGGYPPVPGQPTQPIPAANDVAEPVEPAAEEGTIDVPALPADFIEAAQGPATESTSLSELSIPIVDESA